MQNSEIKFVAVGETDRNGDEYYFTRPNLPVLVDLSQVVMFFRPDEDENGRFFLDIAIKRYTGKRANPQNHTK